MAEQRFSFRGSDEDGGNPANIAASGSEQIGQSAMREQLKENGQSTWSNTTLWPGSSKLEPAAIFSVGSSPSRQECATTV